MDQYFDAGEFTDVFKVGDLSLQMDEKKMIPWCLDCNKEVSICAISFGVDRGPDESGLLVLRGYTQVNEYEVSCHGKIASFCIDDRGVENK